jgi:hypothetical protein
MKVMRLKMLQPDFSSNREAGGFSPVQVDDEGKPRTMDGIDLAWADWWAFDVFTTRSQL